MLRLSGIAGISSKGRDSLGRTAPLSAHALGVAVLTVYAIAATKDLSAEPHGLVVSLQLSREGARIAGTLRGPDGKPMANASIGLSAEDVGARLGPQPRHLEGRVPDRAVTAVIGIRAGIEGACICSGPTGAVVGPIHYREKGRPKAAQDISLVKLPIEGAPASSRTYELVPGDTVLQNLRQFPVVAGADYTFDTAIAAPAAAEHAGYVTIVFLDAGGKELRRDDLWFASSVLDLGHVSTDDEGRFSATLSPLLQLAEPQVRARFDGDDALQPAVAITPSPLGSLPSSLPALQRTRATEAVPLKMLFVRGDFTQAFAAGEPDAAFEREWSRTAGRIQAAHFSGAQLLKQSDEVLARIVRDLQRRGIGLGVEILATNWYHERPCGGGEGFIDPGSANQVVAKLLKAGATVDQLGMDGPLWGGHYAAEGKNPCKGSIPETAGRAATILRIYKAAFPRASVGDIEPFPALTNRPDHAQVYGRWVAAFRQAVGAPIEFLRFDVNWNGLKAGRSEAAYESAVTQLLHAGIALARDNGLKADLIVDGGPGNYASATPWMSSAREHVRLLRASGLKFDHYLVECWDRYPDRTLPESDPNALASLLPQLAD